MIVECKRDKYRYIRLTVRFINPTYGIESNTNFCIDTGAPFSVISYEQACMWGIPFDKLPRTSNTLRVGGTEATGYILNGSKILLRDSRTAKLVQVDVPKIFVLGPPFNQKGLPVPGLLGDDILRDFTLIVESDKSGGRVILTDQKVEYKFI